MKMEPYLIPHTKIDFVTCNKSNHQIFSSSRMLTFDPDCFEAIKSVEIDKIGAAETGDNWKPPSIWGQAREKTISKVKMMDKSH